MKKVRPFVQISENWAITPIVVTFRIATVVILNIILKGIGGTLENGTKHFLDGNWKLVIAHPPCTFLAVSGARWYYHPDDKNLPIEQRRPHPEFPDRAKDREDAVRFFMDVSKIGVDKLAIENPVGIMNSQWRRPDQIIEPWMFGHEAGKKTCLWLKNLPLLIPTDIVRKGEVYTAKSENKSDRKSTRLNSSHPK